MANKEAEPVMISFEKLGFLLSKKGKKWQYLRDCGISPGIVAKMKDGSGHTDTRTIQKVCEILHCQPGQIMEYKPVDKETYQEDAEKAENSREIQKTVETRQESKKIDLQALYEEYGKDAILSAVGQINIMGKYGNELLQELVKYAKEQEPKQPTEPDQIEPEDEPPAETLCEDNTDHLLELQSAIEVKKAAQDKAAEDAQRAEEERIEREKAENVAEIMAIAERLRNGEEPKEDPEKEQLRNVSKVLANTQYYQ